MLVLMSTCLGLGGVLARCAKGLAIDYQGLLRCTPGISKIIHTKPITGQPGSPTSDIW